MPSKVKRQKSWFFRNRFKVGIWTSLISSILLYSFLVPLSMIPYDFPLNVIIWGVIAIVVGFSAMYSFIIIVEVYKISKKENTKSIK